MPIYASTKTHNTDPEPWTFEGFGVTGRAPRHLNVPNAKHAPRAEYDQPRAHDGNPILIAARENWDHGSDPWGQALSWLAAGMEHDSYADADEAKEFGAPWEVQTLISLRMEDGEWTLPRATDDHLNHAMHVFDRIADVARALGLDY